jgi:hypothetical protein
VLAVVAGSAFTIATTASVVALTPGTSSAAPTWVASTAATAGLSPEPVTTFNGGIHLTSVACASTTSCVAVGYYDYGYGGNGTQGLIETGALSGGSWQWKAITAPEGGLTPGLLTAGDPQGDVMLRAVSCGTSTSCTAVGQYSDGTQLANGFNAIIETGTSTGGSWSWVSSSLSPGSLHPTLYTADGTNLGAVYLSAVSCSSSTCVATGYYTYVPSGAPAQVPEPLFWVDASGGWKQETTSTSGLNPAFGSPPKTISDSLRAVSCPTTTSCVAVGGYDDAAGTEYGVVVRGNPVSGTWTDSNAVTPTSPATVAGFLFTGVACASSTSCVVAGSGGQSEAGDIAETGTLKNNTWAWSDVSLPSSMDFVNGAAVSCPSGTYCVIAGEGLNDTAGQYHVQFESGAYADGKWSWTVANAPTNGLNPAISHSYSLLLTGVSCKLTTCVGVGSYTYGSNSYSGLFETLTISAGSTEGIVVNTTSDEKIDEAALSPASGTPFCAIDARADDRQCSLRAAIELANKLGGDQSITFDIPGQGAPKIAPASSLPTVTASVTFDGTTQSGGWVELSGASAGSGDGLSLEGANSTVRGLVINGFSGGAGIKLAKGSGDVIAGDRIGTDASGMTAVPNKYGVYVDAPSATIGGITGTSATSCSGDCDLLSGNTEAQIFGESTSGTSIAYGALKVQGDWIGADAAGDAALPGSYGVKLVGNDDTFFPPSDAVFIGGDTSRPGLAPGNLVVSSDGRGVDVHGLEAKGKGGIGATISGNLIGLSPSGQVALGRGLDGIVAEGDIMIGGTDKGAANVVSGFKLDGIYAENSQIIGNLVGTNVDGTAAIGNLVGVEEKFVTMDDNVVSGNSTGVTGSEYVTLGYGNIIGLNKDGTAAVPNGVGIDSGLILAGIPRATFPGITCPTSPCNVISGNKNAGIESDTSELIDIQGAYIGTDITGKIAIPNGTGIVLSDVTRSPTSMSDTLKSLLLFVNGANPGDVARAGNLHEPPTLRLGGSTNVAQTGVCSFPCNIVAGNTGDGVFLQSYVGLANLANRTSYVEGNLIGVGADGNPLPNGGPGILITGVPDTEQMIIGNSAGTGNILAGSSSPAISIARKTGEIETPPVQMTGNSFRMDGTAAPIAYLLPPLDENPKPPRLFDVAQVGSDIEVKGQISARDFFGHNQTLELYATSSCMGTLRSMGLYTVTNLSGDFDVKIAKADLVTSKFISALVTDGDGRTSKFPALTALPGMGAPAC